MNLVINYLPGTFVVDRKDSLVHLVSFVPVLVADGPAMARVVEEEASGREKRREGGRNREHMSTANPPLVRHKHTLI